MYYNFAEKASALSVCVCLRDCHASALTLSHFRWWPASLPSSTITATTTGTRGLCWTLCCEAQQRRGLCVDVRRPLTKASNMMQAAAVAPSPLFDTPPSADAEASVAELHGALLGRAALPEDGVPHLDGQRAHTLTSSCSHAAADARLPAGAATNAAQRLYLRPPPRPLSSRGTAKRQRSLVLTASGGSGRHGGCRTGPHGCSDEASDRPPRTRQLSHRVVGCCFGMLFVSLFPAAWQGCPGARTWTCWQCLRATAQSTSTTRPTSVGLTR